MVELDRSSTSEFACASCSMAASALVGLFSGVSAAVAVPARWSSFARGIGSLSWKRFARYLKFFVRGPAANLEVDRWCYCFHEHAA